MMFLFNCIIFFPTVLCSSVSNTFFLNMEAVNIVTILYLFFFLRCFISATFKLLWNVFNSTVFAFPSLVVTWNSYTNVLSVYHSIAPAEQTKKITCDLFKEHEHNLSVREIKKLGLHSSMGLLPGMFAGKMLGINQLLKQGPGKGTSLAKPGKEIW